MRSVVAMVHTPSLGGGRALRSHGVIRALALLGTVDVAYVTFGDGEPAPALGEDPAVRLHPVDSSRGAARALAYLRARTAGTPPGFARGVSPELAREVARLQDGADRVIADGPTAAATLLDLAKRRPVTYNAHNLESAFRHRTGDTSLGTQEQLARFERLLLERCVESWMCSPADLAGARELAPQAALRFAPNVVDVAAITPVSRPARSGQLLLVADYAYAPNAQAARFLVDEVMPRVWAEHREATLRLVGRGLPFVPADPRVQAAGFVDDLHGAYAAAACAVVPLLEGGGSPLKFVEALAHGVPVVASAKAAAGLELRAGVEYLQGDGAEGLAARIGEVLAGGAEEVAAAGRRAAEQHHSIAALAELLR